MRILRIFLLSVFAAGLAGAATNSAGGSGEASRGATVAPDPVEKEYQKLLDADDAAQEEVDQWIQQNQEAVGRGAGVPEAELNRRIYDRLAIVKAEYERFLRRHPNHAKAHIAYGSFLGDTADEEGARKHWEIALKLDTNNPAIYSNLAGIYSHTGPVEKAFSFYHKAIELNPREPTYYYNLGTVVYLFRNDAREYYKIDENQVFAKAFELYSNAMRLDPENFPLASDVAQTYYGITPVRVEAALQAWTNAFRIARDDIEREGVHVHFARVKGLAGRYDEARYHLELVKNPMYDILKGRVRNSIDDREKKAKEEAAGVAADKP